MEMHQDERMLELELMIAVGVLFTIALCFLLVTIIKKGIKIRKVKKVAELQKIIDDLVYKILFSTDNLDECIAIYKIHKRKKLFKKLLVKSLVSLHRSYVGEPKLNIEKFYKESNLCLYSVRKLKEKKWVQKVEAIRDLSKLNYQDSYELILKFTEYDKDVVKKEAITGVILLKGFSELIKFKESKLFFDDWMQTNFLYSLKIKQWQVTDLNPGLFTSENESFLLLLARIIELYHIHDFYDRLYEIQQNVTDVKIKKDLSNIIARLK